MLSSVISGFLVVLVGIASARKNTCIQPSNPDFDRMCMKVHGQSGKITLGFPNSTDSDDPKANDAWLQVRYRNLTEMDTDGYMVGKSGSQDMKHSFSSFASLDFDISDLAEVDVDGVMALRFNMTADFMQGGSKTMIMTDFLVFTEDGDDIDVGGNGTVNIKAGDIKWNLAVDDWTWCDETEANCKMDGTNFEEGAALMVNMEISGPNGSLSYLNGGGQQTTGGSGNTQPCSGPAAANNPFCQEGNDVVDADFGGYRIGLVLEDAVRYGDAISRSFDGWEPMMSGYPELYTMASDDDEGDGEGNDAIGVNLVFERRAGRSAMEYDPFARQLPVADEPRGGSARAVLTSAMSLVTAMVLLY